MATQSGVVVPKVNEPYEVTTSLPVPSPGPKQALLKTLAVAINPV
jgi:NADPH:quinone reductase-like Zn-dependent oxidoreductase